MTPEPPTPPNVLTLILAETMAKRLAVAAAKARRSSAELVVEILNRNLPQLDDPTRKRVPYT